MTDMLDRIRSELDDRLAALRPLVHEHARLQRASDALDGSIAPASPDAAPAPASAVTRVSRRPRAKPARRRRAARGGAARAAPGQTQLRVIEQLRSDPGSTSTTVARALGISANAAAATISRLVKQGRVQRLEAGGYAPAVAAASRPEAAAVTAPVTAPVADSIA